VQPHPQDVVDVVNLVPAVSEEVMVVEEETCAVHPPPQCVVNLVPAVLDAGLATNVKHEGGIWGGVGGDRDGCANSVTGGGGGGTRGWGRRGGGGNREGWEGLVLGGAGVVDSRVITSGHGSTTSTASTVVLDGEESLESEGCGGGTIRVKEGGGGGEGGGQVSVDAIENQLQARVQVVMSLSHDLVPSHLQALGDEFVRALGTARTGFLKTSPG
jgi:hypothetical protein